jgi:hypothetical protein
MLVSNTNRDSVGVLCQYLRDNVIVCTRDDPNHTSERWLYFFHYINRFSIIVGGLFHDCIVCPDSLFVLHIEYWTKKKIRTIHFIFLSIVSSFVRRSKPYSFHCRFVDEELDCQSPPDGGATSRRVESFFSFFFF